jgi:hypothetical protein
VEEIAASEEHTRKCCLSAVLKPLMLPFFQVRLFHPGHQESPVTQALQGLLLSFDFYGIMLWELPGHRSELKVARYKI